MKHLLSRTMRPSTIPLIVFAFFVHSTAVSQELPDSTLVYELDPVVVTATQLEALRSRVPNSVSLLTRAEIKNSGETSVLPLLARRIPGVFVTERGVLGFGVSTGAAGTIMIRGTGGGPNTQVLVMTDGRPQMMGLFGHPLPDTYVSSGIERVEVIRGPASLLYGTNAMGGVVNIIYERPGSSGRALEAGASYGSFDTKKLELGGSYGSAAGGIAVLANHYNTSGHRPFSSFKSSTGSARSGISLGEGYVLNSDLNVTAFRTHDPGTASKPLVNNWVDITRGNAGVSLRTSHSTMQGALNAFINWGRHDIHDGFHSTDQNIGLQFYQGIKVSGGTVTTLGVDYRQYGGKARNQKTGLDYGEHFVNEFSLYGLLQQRVLESLDLTAGVRANHHNLYGWESVPQAGIAVQLGSTITVKGSVSRGFRSPTIRELYLFPAPTPTLEPERMWNYELGLLYSVDRIAGLELTGFVSEGSNLIRVGGVFPRLVLSNSGTFTHRGVEVSGKTLLWQHAELDFSYSFLEPGDQTSANPKHKVAFGGTARFAPATFFLGLQYVSKLYGADFGRKPLPDYSIVDARVTVEIGSGFTAHVAAENILNRTYQILADYPMPGRTIFVGVNWELR